jgi:hypothetical protein
MDSEKTYSLVETKLRFSKPLLSINKKNLPLMLIYVWAEIEDFTFQNGVWQDSESAEK